MAAAVIRPLAGAEAGPEVSARASRELDRARDWADVSDFAAKAALLFEHADLRRSSLGRSRGGCAGCPIELEAYLRTSLSE